MESNLHGLMWFECSGISKEEPLSQFMLQLRIWSVCCLIYYKSLGAHLFHILLICVRRSTHYFVVWRLHCTSNFV